MKKGFTLIELMVAVIIIGVLVSIAVPYYLNAVQSARNTEAVMLWGRMKNMARGKDMTRARADRYEREINDKGRLKHFTLRLTCRIKDSDEICWEGQFDQKEPLPHARYFLATQRNFAQLLCVPVNEAGDSFCATLAARETPDAQLDGKNAYLVQY